MPYVDKIRPAAPPARPAALTAALLAALTVGLAACSTSGHPGPSGTGSAGTHATTSATSAAADPLAGLTATAIMNKAEADITAASSIHFAGNVTDSGQKYNLA